MTKFTHQWLSMPADQEPHSHDCKEPLKKPEAALDPLITENKDQVNGVLRAPSIVIPILQKMRALAPIYNQYGFESEEDLSRFLTAIEKGDIILSQDTLSTIRALKPRHTDLSYLVFIKTPEGEIYLTESFPSRNGANGENGEIDAGMSMAPTRAAQEKWDEKNKRWKGRSGSGISSTIDDLPCGNVDDFLDILSRNGAKEIQIANKKTAETLMRLKMCTISGEWLSDRILAEDPDKDDDQGLVLTPSGITAKDDQPMLSKFYLVGVRIMRNVTKEVGDY